MSRAISFHYNLPLDFWRLWLDKDLVYSCAMFNTVDDSLDDAQTRKLDTICRKLDLKPGEKFFDLGCGWGGLVLHAAQVYGVQAVGLTLSRPQAEYARGRIRQAGLEQRCHVLVGDFSDFEAADRFDKVASIGAIEHVPEGRLGAYFRAVSRLLKPGGRFLNQGITHFPTRPRPRRPSFFDRYVFPGGHLATFTETVQAAESAGFEVRDVESLREHYSLTLRLWRDRLIQARSDIIELVGEETYRTFWIYLAAASHDFSSARNHLFQTLFCVPGRHAASGMLLTRSRWYLQDHLAEAMPAREEPMR